MTILVSGAGGQGPQLAPAPFSSLTWRSIGPTSISGRVNDIAVARRTGRPDEFYVGFGGGVFKSANGGTSWSPVFDDLDAMISVGDLAVAPSDPNVVWVGTGESVNPTLDWGDGVYKSTDAGRTWKRMGLTDSRHIGRVVIHPTNPNVVFVAAQGRMWGSNEERGVFKTTDGGATWKKVLYVDAHTGTNDVQIDPSNPSILYASTYQRERKNYGGILVGPGSAIYKSVDGGDTWRKLTKGLPDVDMGRIGLEISAADPKILFADIEVGGYVVPSSAGGTGGSAADCPPPRGQASNAARNQFDSGKGGLYRSLDGGETWEQVNPGGDTPVGQFSQVRTDPRDRNRVYRLGTGFYVSDDMGKTFRTINSGIHYEHHAMWIDPENSNHVLLGSDGGLNVSWDRGMTWDWKANIPTGQFYEADISLDARDPFIVCGGLQDNGSICVPSATRNRNGIANSDAWTVGGGDGMHFHIDPNNSTYALSDADRAQIRRVSLATLQQASVKPGPGLAKPISCLDEEAYSPNRGRLSKNVLGPDGKPYRWEWDTPILFSSVTPGVAYTAANVLFRSTDRGGSWKRISPDLTGKIDRDTISIMGHKVGALNYSPNGTLIDDPAVTSLFGAIISIGESPLDARVLYTGSNDGQIQVTRDLGATWTNVTRNVPGLPPFTPVSSVVPSRHAKGRVYATFDGHQLDDDHAYVYVSNDYGSTWRAISTGLPMAEVNRIAEHPRSPNLLVVAHRRGVHFSNDAGAHWQSLSTNMPTVPTSTVMFHPRDSALVAATYGRGIWVLDDAGPLEKLTADAMKSDALFVSATRGRQWNLSQRNARFGVAEYYSPNPELNPTINYYVRDGGGASQATLTISDAVGHVVRTMNGPATRGLNSVVWDMRMNSALPRAESGGGGGGGGRGGRGGGRGAAAEGPLVAPGKYSVAIRVDGISRELKGDLTVTGDPNETLSVADRAARRKAVDDLYATQRSIAQAMADLPSSQSQEVVRLRAELTRLVGITGGLMRGIEDFDSAPTADQRQQMAWATVDATRAFAAVRRLGSAKP